MRKIIQQIKEEHNVNVIEPITVVLTAYASKALKAKLKAENIHLCYEKPLSLKQLNEIMELVS